MDNVLALVTSDAAANFSVEGLTLRNGSASTVEDGGGLYAKTSGDVTLTNNIFTGNTATNGNGGGTYVSGTGTLTNNTFSGNTAIHGGGAYVYQTGSLTNNTFSGNTATKGNGGGTYVYGTGTLTNNTFTGNTATDGYGGGAYVHRWHYSQTGTLTNNTFTGNTGKYGGGAYVSSGTLTNNTFTGNTATDDGGGAFVHGVTLTNKTFAGNTASDGNGGGAYVYQTGTLTNNTFTGNTGKYGGGAYVGNGTLTNNTLTGNTASSQGGGIWVIIFTSYTGKLYNNIIWNNTAPEAADLYIDNTGDDPFFPVPVDIFNNNFDQSSSGTYIAIPFTIDSSNLDNEEPLFVGDGNYHLTAYSPCINAGDNDAPDLPDTDKDGNPRIIGGTVDMGAYEYNSSVPTANAGPDQTVDSGATVTLDGSGSSDPGRETLTYLWTQISGVPVTLSDTTAIQPTFTAPSGGTSLIFDLEVTNETGLKDKDSVTVTVKSDETVKPCYQFYNPTWVDHHFTINEDEAASLKANPQWGWNYVGISWYAYEKKEGAGSELSIEGFELKPCYQFYNPTWVDHHFTINEDEAASLKANPQWGWNYVGISWYAYEKKTK